MADSEQQMNSEETTELTDLTETENDIDENEDVIVSDSLERIEHDTVEESSEVVNTEEWTKSEGKVTVDTIQNGYEGIKKGEWSLEPLTLDETELEAETESGERVDYESSQEEVKRGTSQQIWAGTDSETTGWKLAKESSESKLALDFSKVLATPCVSNISSNLRLYNLSQRFRMSSLTSLGSENIIPVLEELYLEPSLIPFTDFTEFEIQVIVAILSELFMQFKLLKNCLPFPMFDWKQVSFRIDEHFNTIMGNIKDRIFTDYYEHDKKLLWKLQIDLYEISKIVNSVADEINAKGSYDTLLQFIDDLNYIKGQEITVFYENTYLQKLLVIYRRKYLKKEAELAFKNMPEAENTFVTEEEKAFDCNVWHQIECRYIESWEKARRLQNTMKIEKKESGLIETLKNLAFQQSRDSRVTAEIETYLATEIGNLERKLEQWTNKYNQELEERDIELTIMYAEKESIDNRLKSMLVTFNERDEAIQELKGFFAEKEKEEEIKFQLNKAATIIQKWWKKYRKMKRKYLHELKLFKKMLKEQKAAKAKLNKAKKI